ncbi:myo-inositol 2-dehydrogenase [Paenibacillus uliginis N3/975]|uniref:Myo-inositol 2-dehydrogenase n=1 Tax=Paenibacillus uliginis N3/975 TaxID=1313296 RepID=A0A1X7H6V0_9BACL|nr:inositol 2-dehydrogenase [Paenibacillus uliginis]SMF80675.1 myo-inositol 2-dehydrogenase [Paenibacillus uliginis N3/975]
MFQVGIIGAGRIGKLHAEHIQRTSMARVRAVSDVNMQGLDTWASSLHIPVVTDNYQDLLNDPDIDAIFICSPTSTHATIIQEAARAGKHIFCEKPVSFSVETTELALQAVYEANVMLQVGFNRRFDHNFKKVRDTVQGGVIGEPHLLRITSRDPEPPPAEYVAKSGGLFMDMMIHDFDMARYVVQSEVVEVYAQGANLIDPKIGELNDVDTAVVMLTFANGAIGIIENSRKAVYGYDQRIEAFGSKGCISTENDRPSTAVISTSDGVMMDKPLYFFLERYTQAYVQEIEDFFRSIQGEFPIVCDGNDGLQAERLAQAAKESLLTGRPVKLNHVTVLDRKSL